jgi:hypothetical protein
MNMNRHVLVKSIAFVLFLLPTSASALTISPTKIEVSADPGQELIGEIDVFNEEQEDKTFYSSYENFEPRGETGSPYFVGGGSGLSTWMKTQDSFTIKPGERLKIPYSIKIPDDATAGGYFAAIFFGTQPPATGEGSEVAVGGKVGSLVLLRLNGDINESGGVLDFSTVSNKKFFTALPIDFSYRFNNTGGDRVVPKGELRIKNLLGLESGVLSVNKNEGSVLPNSIRKFDVTWTEEETLASDATFIQAVKYQASHFRFGVYFANIEAVWGESSMRGEDSTWFVVLPWQLLIVLIVLGTVLRFLLRFYNQHIITKANKAK